MGKNDVVGFFDGSCEPINPGGAARWGFVLYIGNERIARTGFIGEGAGMTNNIAEYRALIELLKEMDRRNISGEVCGDSDMVINMTTRRWGKKHPHKKALHLLPLLEEARCLYDKLRVTLYWIPREENEEADEMSKMGVDI